MKNKIWLLGLAMILLAIVAALALGLAKQSNGPVNPGKPPALGGTQTAQQAYAALQRWASKWANDTRTIAVSGSLSRDGLGSGWTFQVYSPKTKKLAIVMVKEDEVTVVREQRALYPQQTMSIDAWKLDSEALLAHWWQERGYVTWANPDAHTVYLNLSAREQGLLSWKLSVINPEGDLLEFWEARADTGETIQVYKPGGG